MGGNSKRVEQQISDIQEKSEKKKTEVCLLNGDTTAEIRADTFGTDISASDTDTAAAGGTTPGTTSRMSRMISIHVSFLRPALGSHGKIDYP